MKVGALFAIVRQNLGRGRRSVALSIFGIAVGIAALSFFLALSAGVRRVVLGQVFPVGQLEVVAAKSSLGGEGPLGMFSALAGPKVIDDAAATLLSAQPEVRAAYRHVKLAFPGRAWGGERLIGRNFYTELIAEGVDPAAMAGDRLGPEPFSDSLGSQKPCSGDGDCTTPEYCPWDTHLCERPVPAVVSPFLVEMYNGTLAAQTGLPKITRFVADRLRGLTFQLELGRSFLGQAKGATEPHQRRAMLVGISPQAAPLAVTLPLGFVQRWNRQYATSVPAVSSLVLQLRPGADVTRLAAKVRELGFEVADEGAERAGLAITLITLLFALVSLSMVTIAALNIAQTFFRIVAERRRELGVLRAIGASRADVRGLVLAEAALIGVAGGLFGLAAARLIALGVDVAARRFVPDFPFKPETYFAFTWPLCLGALGCALGACVLGAYWPARAAARLEPTEALTAP